MGEKAKRVLSILLVRFLSSRGSMRRRVTRTFNSIG